MKAILANIVFGAWLIVLPGLAAGQDTARREPADETNAKRASQEILASLRQNQFDRLWDRQTSQFYKSRVTKQSFIANLTIGRAQFGSPGQSEFVDESYSQTDPSTGFRGEIYAFNYLNSYSVGRFYQRIVVVKENDGKFRLAGLRGAPANR